MIATFVVMIVYFALSLLIAWQITLSLIGFSLLSGLAMMRLYRVRAMPPATLIHPLNAELQTSAG